jgi:protein tyrosine phosphatase
MKFQVERFQVERFQDEKFQVERFQVERLQVERFKVERFQVERFQVERFQVGKYSSWTTFTDVPMNQFANVYSVLKTALRSKLRFETNHSYVGRQIENLLLPCSMNQNLLLSGLIQIDKTQPNR